MKSLLTILVFLIGCSLNAQQIDNTCYDKKGKEHPCIVWAAKDTLRCVMLITDVNINNDIAVSKHGYVTKKRKYLGTDKKPLPANLIVWQSKIINQ